MRETGQPKRRWKQEELRGRGKVGLKQAISNYFAQKAEDEIDKMWADGTLTEEKVESFRTLHERTPYKK